MRGSAARALVPAVLVLGLVAVVAVAATGSTAHGTGRIRPPAATLIDTLLSLSLLAVVAGGALLVYGLVQRRAIAEELASGRYPRTSIVGWILFVLAFAALAYVRRTHWGHHQASTDADNVISGARRPPGSPSSTAANATAYTPHFAWIPVAVALVLVAAAAVAYLAATRRQRPLARKALAEDVTAVVDDTLDDLRAESDPRRAVVAAYVRLERVLTRHGLSRRRSDTEEEYLARMLETLELPPPSARRLTVLFERASFSPHDVDLGMKEEAIGALEEIRDALGAKTSEPTGGAPVGAAS
jgi:hypothetical protein